MATSRSWTSGFSRALSQDTLRPIPRPSALQYALLVAWQRLRKGVIRTQHASLLGTSGGQLAKVYQRRPSGQTTYNRQLSSVVEEMWSTCRPYQTRLSNMCNNSSFIWRSFCCGCAGRTASFM
ncbi:hypothetical protein KC352_g63 [Hortaea werneckii]|nr:hypothetical protein KC352_g63 [Hortaea werneckii]